MKLTIFVRIQYTPKENYSLCTLLNFITYPFCTKKRETKLSPTLLFLASTTLVEIHQPILLFTSTTSVEVHHLQYYNTIEFCKSQIPFDILQSFIIKKQINLFINSIISYFQFYAQCFYWKIITFFSLFILFLKKEQLPLNKNSSVTVSK